MLKNIFISGMHCEHCTAAVTTALKEIPGVTSVTVELESGIATVAGSGFDDAALKSAVEDTGFDVIEIA